MAVLNESQLMSTKLNLQKGFSLMEMLVVLIIIGLIVGLIGPSIWRSGERANVDTANTQIKLLKGALETMKLDLGRFPNAQEGLTLLITPPADERLKPRWRGPYLDGAAVPSDPWGTPYQYSLPGVNGQPFALYSLGADKKRGGEGNDADIGYLPPQ